MEIELACRRGDVIGGAYVIDDLVGVGGMGVVYRAVDRSGNAVVVKVPRTDLASEPIVRQRFRIEALAGARVKHDNVARVLDHGEDSGVPFLIMEQVIGQRLGELVGSELPVVTSIAVVRQILDGVAAMHASRVIHGDLKCDNVLVETMRGQLRPRVIDFGLARLLGDDWIADAAITGTPEYLAPEVILGTPPTIASDLYAVGVMLYELCAGTTPFPAQTIPEIMGRHLSDTVLPIAQRRAGIPDELDDVVACALAKVPSSRFPDAAAFISALDTIEVRTAPPAIVEVPFSTDAPTVRISQPRISPAESARRAAARALDQQDVVGFLVAHLELARVLVGDHDLATAIVELEGAILRLSQLGPAARESPIWRLQLTLAGLYDWRGDRARALRVARAARTQANDIGSAVGSERANELIERLGWTGAVGTAPPW